MSSLQSKGGIDYPISHLRLVRVTFFHVDLQGNNIVDKVPHMHYMHASQVDAFMRATLALHFEPGINPYNGNATSKVWAIHVSPLETETKSYWWCSPDLKANSAEGAMINQDQFFYSESRKWAHPILLREEKEAAERDAKAEYETRMSDIARQYPTT